MYVRYFCLKIFRSIFETEDQRISKKDIKLKTLERLEEMKFTLNGLPQADIIIMRLHNMTAVVVIKSRLGLEACHVWVESYLAMGKYVSFHSQTGIVLRE